MATLLTVAPPTFAQRRPRPPEQPLTYASPAAIAPSQSTVVTFRSPGVGQGSRIWTSFDAKARRLYHNDERDLIADEARYEILVPSHAPDGIHAVRLTTSAGLSSLQPLMIDRLPSRPETPGNQSPSSATSIEFNTAVEGAVDELTHDYFRFHATKGQRISIEVVAQRLGSRLDPVLRLLDESGRELAYSDDDPAVGADSRIAVTAPKDGAYLIELRDINYGGGLGFRYRLRVGDFAVASAGFPLARRARLDAPRVEESLEAEPNDLPEFATPFSLPCTIHGMFHPSSDRSGDRDHYRFYARKSESLAFAARTRSLGSPCDVRMKLFDPDGKQVAESKADAADEGLLAYKFPGDGAYVLRVEELNRRSGSDLAYRILADRDPGVFLSVEVDKIDTTPGGESEIKVTAVRRGYTGVITFASPELADRFPLSNNTIADGKTETTLKIKVPDDAKTGGPWHFTLVGYAGKETSSPGTVVSTGPALKKLFPTVLHPPVEWDGMIGLGIKSK